MSISAVSWRCLRCFFEQLREYYSNSGLVDGKHPAGPQTTGGVRPPGRIEGRTKIRPTIKTRLGRAVHAAARGFWSKLANIRQTQCVINWPALETVRSSKSHEYQSPTMRSGPTKVIPCPLGNSTGGQGCPSKTQAGMAVIGA